MRFLVRFANMAEYMNLRECVTCMPLPRANKAAHSAFEIQRRRHQKSKTRVSAVTSTLSLKARLLKLG